MTGAEFESTFAGVRDTVAATDADPAVVGIGLAVLAEVRDELVDVPLLDLPWRDDARDRRR